MSNFLSVRVTSYGLLFIFSFIIVIHFLVLAGIIPFEIVWGGRIKDSSELVVFEVFSITINLLMIFVVGVKVGLVKLKLNTRFIQISLWLMFVLFLINTIGNLFSISQLEKFLFTPITLILAILSLRLALSKSM